MTNTHPNDPAKRRPQRTTRRLQPVQHNLSFYPMSTPTGEKM